MINYQNFMTSSFEKMLSKIYKQIKTAQNKQEEIDQ